MAAAAAARNSTSAITTPPPARRRRRRPAPAPAYQAELPRASRHKRHGGPSPPPPGHARMPHRGRRAALRRPRPRQTHHTPGRDNPLGGGWPEARPHRWHPPRPPQNVARAAPTGGTRRCRHHCRHRRGGRDLWISPPGMSAQLHPAPVAVALQPPLRRVAQIRRHGCRGQIYYEALEMTQGKTPR